MTRLPLHYMRGPMAFKGVVTKVGFMNKTATVTVTRNTVDKKTQKVRVPPLLIIAFSNKYML